MTTSNTAKPLYIYLQRPDTSEWIVAGRYRFDTDSAIGFFRYANSYLEQAQAWSIDPINLPIVASVRPAEIPQAARYGGLHDVLRDACPDAWGQALIRRQHGLPDGAAPVRYLPLAGNGDRWGALAVGSSPKPSVAHLASPKLARLDVLALELTAIAENRPPVDAGLRRRLFATPSLGGARPKATVVDGNSAWLVKPGLRTDTVDLALLEHATQQWGRYAGLNFADTRHHPMDGARSVVRVLRFDRKDNHRVMAVSAASLLQVEYPAANSPSEATASYGRLAMELRRIGAPEEDWKELFGRMIFNGVVGNDDDHVRNHAAIFNFGEQRWRLAPAYDVVPNPDETPTRLVMQTCAGRYDITREAMLGDYRDFGFQSKAQAAVVFDDVVRRIERSFEKVAPLLSPSLRQLLEKRLRISCVSLRKQAEQS